MSTPLERLLARKVVSLKQASRMNATQENALNKLDDNQVNSLIKLRDELVTLRSDSDPKKRKKLIQEIEERAYKADIKLIKQELANLRKEFLNQSDLTEDMYEAALKEYEKKLNEVEEGDIKGGGDHLDAAEDTSGGDAGAEAAEEAGEGAEAAGEDVGAEVGEAVGEAALGAY